MIDIQPLEYRLKDAKFPKPYPNSANCHFCNNAFPLEEVYVVDNKYVFCMTCVVRILIYMKES